MKNWMNSTYIWYVAICHAKYRVKKIKLFGATLPNCEFCSSRQALEEETLAEQAKC